MRNEISRILLVTAPISRVDKGIESYDYFAALVSELAIKLESKYPNVEIVIKVPGVTLDKNNDQINFINTGLLNDFNCIIISPFNVDSLLGELENWKQGIIDKRLIFIDQGFDYITDDQKEYLREKQIPTPPYVQANWIQGGQKAAESAFNYLREQKITAPHIVLLEGIIGSRERIEGFKNFLENKLSDNFYPSYFSYNARYDKEEAKNFFASYLQQCISSKRPIDVVFTTNDEMALGVREALFDAQSELEANIPSNQPKIIGFDGIKDLTLLIDKNNNDFIYDTISVDLKNQISEVIRIIENYIEKKKDMPDNEKYVSTDCYSFRNEFIDKKKTAKK